MLATAYQEHFDLRNEQAPTEFPWAKSAQDAGVFQPTTKRSTGEYLYKPNQQKDFLLKLNDTNALARLGMITTAGLTGKVGYAVQDTVVTALWRDSGGSAHTFEDAGLSISTFLPLAISLSMVFPRTLAKSHSESMAGYIEEMLASEGGKRIELACLLGTNANGQPLGLLTESAQSGSSASIQSFGSGGVATTDLVAMLETLGGKGAGLKPTECGWLCHPEMLGDLLALSNPDGTGPLVTLGSNNRRYALQLPIEVSSNMPTNKLLLSNFRQSIRLLIWEPSPDFLFDEYSVAGQVRVLATMYVNVALTRTDLVVVGQ
jgi:HK97 family phage major capsid protein